MSPPLEGLKKSHGGILMKLVVGTHDPAVHENHAAFGFSDVQGGEEIVDAPAILNLDLDPIV